LRPQVADAALGRSGDDDRSTAAGDELPVDENILAIVDRDVVTVRVGVDASAAAGGLVVGGVSGRRGQGDNGQGAKQRRCVLEAGQLAGGRGGHGGSSRDSGAWAVEENHAI
jgi:hypothetical protein